MGCLVKCELEALAEANCDRHQRLGSWLCDGLATCQQQSLAGGPANASREPFAHADSGRARKLKKKLDKSPSVVVDYNSQ